MKKRTLALLCAVTMVIGIAVGGSLAWLMDSTNAVTNTFTTTDVNIKLYETEEDDTGPIYERRIPMVPGTSPFKNPTVEVEANSVACYLFVKVTEKNNSLGEGAEAFSPVSWSPLVGNEAWTELVNNAGEGLDFKLGSGERLFYRTVDAATATQGHVYQILKDNQVKIDSRVTKDDMTAWKNAPETCPQLIFTAYAIQSEALDVSAMDDIWALAAGLETGSTTP